MGSVLYQQSSAIVMNFLILEDVTDWLSRNVCKELPYTLRSNPNERRFQTKSYFTLVMTSKQESFLRPFNETPLRRFQCYNTNKTEKFQLQKHSTACIISVH